MRQRWQMSWGIFCHEVRWLSTASVPIGPTRISSWQNSYRVSFTWILQSKSADTDIFLSFFDSTFLSAIAQSVPDRYYLSFIFLLNHQLTLDGDSPCSKIFYHSIAPAVLILWIASRGRSLDLSRLKSIEKSYDFNAVNNIIGILAIFSFIMTVFQQDRIKS